MTGKTRVVIKEKAEPAEMLFAACTEAGLFEGLEALWKSSGKRQDDFQIAVKPNFMVLTSASDRSNCTDTDLVVLLLWELASRGFTNLALVESENVLSQWYRNRSVQAVAQYAGYKGDFYSIVSLTHDVVPHYYNGILKYHTVGRRWKEADFRISFAKNKTHPAATYTLTMKNIFGCTPADNKYLVYHKSLEWDQCVIDMLDTFPVHFGIVDAIVSADGAFGFRGSKRPKKTDTIIAGQSCLAVDWVGALKMGCDPLRSRLMKTAVKKWGKPDYDVSGPLAPYPGWCIPPAILPWFDDKLEEWYEAHSFFTHCIMLPPDPEFPEPGAWLYSIIRAILGLRYP
jgi:uncharacterized protein (DUF362 family)